MVLLVVLDTLDESTQKFLFTVKSKDLKYNWTFQ